MIKDVNHRLLIDPQTLEAMRASVRTWREKYGSFNRKTSPADRDALENLHHWAQQADAAIRISLIETKR